VTQGWAAVLRDPVAEVSYAGVLTVEPAAGERRWLGAVRGLAGAGLGVLTMLAVVPVANLVLTWLGWLVSGSPGDFTTFRAAAARFENPIGMLAAHLALALLLPLSLALVVLVHGVRPRWLHSVQPGFRWAWAVQGVLVAAVVFGLLLVGSNLGQFPAFRPQPGFWWFLPVILLTSPLQAAAEEYFFRGYLLQALNLVVPGRWFGLVGSALVFALFHGTQNLPLFLDRFGFGLVAGVLVLRTGGLEAGIAAHVVNNVFAFTWAGLTSSIAAVKATQVIGWAEAAWDVAGFAVFALVALLLGRRMNLAATTPS
jgi:membrane protease YdiL (CAAX protease family)